MSLVQMFNGCLPHGTSALRWIKRSLLCNNTSNSGTQFLFSRDVECILEAIILCNNNNDSTSNKNKKCTRKGAPVKNLVITKHELVEFAIRLATSTNGIGYNFSNQLIALIDSYDCNEKWSTSPLLLFSCEQREENVTILKQCSPILYKHIFDTELCTSTPQATASNKRKDRPAENEQEGKDGDDVEIQTNEEQDKKRQRT